jgi:hypothetical protein
MLVKVDQEFVIIHSDIMLCQANAAITCTQIAIEWTVVYGGVSGEWQC